MTKKRKIWIVVADGSRARIFTVPSEGHEFVEIDSLASEEAHLLSHEQKSDRPGRSQESGMAARHALESRTDPQRAQKQAFVRSLAEKIAAARRDGLFDALVLAAAPRALGDLRQALDEPTLAMVIRQVDKDLTKIPKHELPEHLRDLLPGGGA